MTMLRGSVFIKRLTHFPPSGKECVCAWVRSICGVRCVCVTNGPGYDSQAANITKLYPWGNTGSTNSWTSPNRLFPGLLEHHMLLVFFLPHWLFLNSFPPNLFK